MANPNMKKGAPSVNAHGRGAPFKRAEVAKAASAKHAPGSTGIIAFSGFVSTAGERSASMIGRQKWIEYANAPIRSAPVAIAYLLRNALFGGVKWSLVENEAGGKAAKKGLEVCQKGLLDARMPTPWRSVVPKALNGNYFAGFSIHATAMARRKDGLVTYTEIEHRPQHTAYQWLRKSPTDPFTDVVQRTDDGMTYTIPLADCFYLKNTTIADGPEGQGVLRLICERIRRTEKYRGLEGTELFSSMGGTPIARAPLEEIAAGAVGKAESELLAYIDAATQAIEDAVSSRIKNPSEQLYLKLDSKTYQGTDPNTISTVPKWGVEIVKGELAGVTEIRKVITDSDLDDARILGVEFCFIGGGDTRGTFSAHESKVSMFASQLSADIDMAGEQGTQQICRPLVAANGIDPDEGTPTLVASPIGTDDVEKTCRALGLLNMAGLTPNHPAKKTIFDRMSLPWEDEPEPVLPRSLPPAPAGGDPNQGNPGGVPARVDPAATNVEPQQGAAP